jgi:hypothetical protein
MEVAQEVVTEVVLVDTAEAMEEDIENINVLLQFSYGI